jgi:hypothetical protein
MLLGKTDAQLDAMWDAWKELTEVERSATASEIAKNLSTQDMQFVKGRCENWKKVGITTYVFTFLELCMEPITRQAMQQYLSKAQLDGT